MKINWKYPGTILGAGVALLGFLPLLSKNGIPVHGFRPELGLGVGYWLLVAGVVMMACAWLAAGWARKAGGLVAGLAFLLVMNTWWQGHKLDAQGWGIWVAVACSGAALGVALIRLLRG